MLREIVTQTGSVEIFGHRGAAGLAPENTMSAFKLAIDSGVRCVEFDVCLTTDEIPVIFHDEDIDRCSNGTGKISDLNWDDLRQLDFGEWFDGSYKNEPLLRLSGLLDYLTKSDVVFNLEIKCHAGVSYRTLVKSIISELANWPIQADKIIVSSFNRPALNYFHLLCPTITTAMLVESKSVDWIQWHHECGATAVHIPKRLVSASLVKQFCLKGLSVRCYTVNSKKQLMPMLEMGVVGIFTDLPTKFI